jgi:hypothetical protein
MLLPARRFWRSIAFGGNKSGIATRIPFRNFTNINIIRGFDNEALFCSRPAIRRGDRVHVRLGLRSA